jgi:hypothetical protein
MDNSHAGCLAACEPHSNGYGDQVDCRTHGHPWGTCATISCWCRPGAPELPVTMPHRKNDRCTVMNRVIPPGQDRP